MKNIIFFLPNFSIGGASKSIKNICFKIKKKLNVKISVISLGKNCYKKDFVDNNIEVIELKSNRTLFAMIDIYRIIQGKKRIFEVVFVSNINYANVLTCIILKNIKWVKTVLIERTPIQDLFFYNSFIEKVKKKIIFLLLKLFYSRSDYIIGNSKIVSKDLSKIINKKVQTIYPIIKLSKFKKKILKKKVTVGWIGRNSPEKNLNDFLNCLNLIDMNNIKIKILSNNINLKHNKKKIYKKNVKFFKINEQQSKLRKFYDDLNILVSTSYFEGFPNVIAEGINAGCLIICPKNYGGTLDLIKNNSYGFFYKIGDHKDLAEKINLASSDFKKQKIKILNARKNLALLAKKHNDDYLNFFKKI